MTEYERTLKFLKEQRAMLDLVIKTMEYVDQQRLHNKRVQKKYEECRAKLCAYCGKTMCDGCKFKPLDDEDLMTATMLSEV